MLSRFEQEMARQPEALVNLARCAPGALLQRMRAFVRGPVVAAGMGSSLYALGYLRHLLSRQGERLEVFEAAELLQAQPFHPALASRPLLLLSQSGESAEAVQLASAWTGPVALVTNHPGGPISTRATVEFPIQAGVEEGPACITFLNSMGTAWLLAHPDATQAAEDLHRMADLVQRTLTGADGSAIDEVAALLLETPSRVLLGRGLSLLAAWQGALTLQEAAHLWITPMGAATFRHGPMEAADHRMAALLLAPADPSRPMQLALARDLAARGAKVVLLGADLHEPVRSVDLPPCAAMHSPFVETVWLQRLSVAAALRQGQVPGLLEHKVTRVL